MEDRYLFKAKRIDNGEWVHGYYALIDNRHYIYTGSLFNGGLYVIAESFEIDIDTLCACTGLTDKNGNLILENDIVSYCDCTEERYVIAWEPNKACFEYQAYERFIMNFDELGGCEVESIGNVFDNPELLEMEE